MKDYFPEGIVFNKKNIDTSFLRDEMLYWYCNYEYFANELLKSDESRSDALISHTIAEVLKAILVLSVEGNKKHSRFILNGLMKEQK